MQKNKSIIIKSLALSIVAVVALVLGLQGFGKAFPGTFSNLEKLADDYGLLGVFLVVFIGGTLLPFPVGAFYLGIVKLSSQPFLVFIVGVLAAFLSGMLNYYIGYFLEDKIIGRFVKKSSIEKSKKLFDKYGAIAIIVFGAIPLSPVADPITLLCGLVKMNVKKFSVYWMISKILGLGILTIAALFLNFSL